MKYDNREDILQLTPHWEGERDDNGRPRVSDDILKRMQHVALEEAWGVLWGHGYKHQFHILYCLNNYHQLLQTHLKYHIIFL